MRVSVSSTSSPVHSRPSECSGGFAHPPLSSPRLRMDFVSSSCVGAPASVASHHRPLRDVAEPSPTGVFLTHVRPIVCRHRCDVAVVGQAAGLRLPSLQPSSSGVGEGSGFQGPGADVGSSFLGLSTTGSRTFWSCFWRSPSSCHEGGIFSDSHSFITSTRTCPCFS